jgi:hypothetical protein
MKFSLFAVVSALALAAGAAHAATVVVPGTANPFLAGAPSGASVDVYGAIDTSPAESPIALSVTAGETLQISAVNDPTLGAVGNCATCIPGSPAGGYLSTVGPVSTSGFTALATAYPTALPIDSLVGLFNGASPSVFEIGTGGSFRVPTGATTLYLGTVDGYQWNNNVGAYDVTVTPIPEPATWAMMIAGLGMTGATLRVSQRKRALSVA